MLFCFPGDNIEIIEAEITETIMAI